MLRGLGRPCDFLGPLTSAPPFAEFLLDDMRRRGIGHADCPLYADFPVPMSSVILSERTGTRTIIHTNGGQPPLSAADFARVNLDAYAWVHFEGRQPAETVHMMERVVRYNSCCSASRRITVSLDLEKTNVDFSSLLRLADVVFVGKDLAAGSWHCTDMVAAVRRLRAECAESQPRLAVICPWGDRGAACADPDGAVFECEAFDGGAQKTWPVIDSLGAGDTFVAAVIHALCDRPGAWRDAIRFGCRMAGGKVRHLGYDCVAQLQRDWLAA